MTNYGFVRVATATSQVKVADCMYNTAQIVQMISEAQEKGVSIVVFPELSITAYTCADLFLQRILLEESLTALNEICEATRGLSVTAIVGVPVQIGTRLYNTAVVIGKGRIHGVVPKTFLPNYNEFYEKRWFSSASTLKSKDIVICGQSAPVGSDLIFEMSDFRFSIEICEDLWSPIPPSSIASVNGAEIIFNLSASNETTSKHIYRKDLIKQQSARCISGYVYAAAGAGESTTDIVFSGSSVIAENGTVIAESDRFFLDNRLTIGDIDVERLRNDRLKNKSFSVSEYKAINEIEYRYIAIEDAACKKNRDDFSLSRFVSPTPFVPAQDETLDERCSEIFSIQVGGLTKRLQHVNAKTAVIGVSGGLDSTLALLVLVKAFDKLGLSREGIYGITMPGFGTTDRTYSNAIELMRTLGITIREISIVDAVNQHFKDIEHDPSVHDITYENSQARERTQILMNYANKVNGLVIGTGDLSELALGWCTYNGDHMSMYAVNAGVPKTLVKTLVAWVADTQMDAASRKILDDVVETPISPELLPADANGNIAQKTEDVVGPYILHDFYLYYVLRFGFSPAKIYFLAKHAFEGEYQNEVILKWLRNFFWRFFSQQFKRSCLPDGPKVGSVNLSPRGDWRMPSDASVAVWMKELDALS